MDEDRGGWWTALTIFLIIGFLMLTQWGVASLQRVLDWDPSSLPFVLSLAYGFFVLGLVLIVAVLLTRIFVSGLQQVVDEFQESRDRRRMRR